jgi:anti-sigma factor RsiW
MQAVLPALAEREGTPRVAFHAAKHLATCVSCAERLLRLRELNGLLDRIPDEEVPPSFTRRVLRALPRKIGGAGGLVVLAALAGRGPALALANFGLRLAEMARAPFEAAASVISGLLLAMLDLATSARAALQDSPLFLHGQTFRAAGFNVSAEAIPALMLAGAMALGAGLAFWRSLSAHRQERPHPSRLTY